MSDNLPNNPLPDRFKVVTESSSTRNVVRDPAGVQATRTGRSPLNAEASEWVEEKARSEYGGIQQCGIVWAPDEVAKEIGGYLAPPDTPGFTPIKKESDGMLTVYLGKVFDKHPKLRPDTDSWVSFSLKPEGYFIIHLNVPLPRVKPARVRRKAKKADQAPKLTDTQQPATEADSEETA